MRMTVNVRRGEIKVISVFLMPRSLTWVDRLKKRCVADQKSCQPPSLWLLCEEDTSSVWLWWQRQKKRLKGQPNAHIWDYRIPWIPGLCCLCQIFWMARAVRTCLDFSWEERNLIFMRAQQPQSPGPPWIINQTHQSVGRLSGKTPETTNWPGTTNMLLTN